VNFFLNILKVNKIFFVFLLVFLSVFKINAQKIKPEPGIIAGTSYYLGDVNHYKQFYSVQPAYGIIVRFPFKQFHALRLNLIKAELSGNDADFANLYQQTRAYAFTNNLYEIGIQYEFNFLPYSSYIKKTYTPFITTGFAVALSNTTSIAFPMGIGWKYSFGKKMTLALEWVFRNTNSDELDLLLPAENYEKQITNLNNYDWYSLACISITYNLVSEKKWCPAYKKKK